MNRLDSYTPLGYSLVRRGPRGRAGEPRSSPSGQLVACAGNEHALHAEVNWVPTNLCVAVPDGVSPQLAAFATVGSIAMQGVRQAERTARGHRLRDRPWSGRPAGRAALVASGVRVVGLDPTRTAAGWPRRPAPSCAPARPTRASTGVERALARASGGLGADHDLPGLGWLLQPARRAGRPARTRPGDGGRHRQVQAGPALERLLREGARPPVLTLLRARSLRPRYELDGIDYPAGYVRWTERATSTASSTCWP
jgi:hypothetical protein